MPFKTVLYRKVEKLLNVVAYEVLFHSIVLFSKILTLGFVLNLDSGHCFQGPKYAGEGPFRVSGVIPCVSKHNMLPNLIDKQNADCLMVNSPQCSQRGR